MIITLAGKAKSGKTTIAEMLGKQLNPNDHYLFAFADPIKKMVQLMFPLVSERALWGPSELRETIIPGAFDADLNPLTVRRACTDVGKLGRIYNIDLWANSTFDSITKIGSQTSIIYDLRFKSEFRISQKNKAFLARVKRPGNTYASIDISETDLDDVSDDQFDFVLTNDCILEDLPKKVEELKSAVQRHFSASS